MFVIGSFRRFGENAAISKQFVADYFGGKSNATGKASPCTICVGLYDPTVWSIIVSAGIAFRDLYRSRSMPCVQELQVLQTLREGWREMRSLQIVLRNWSTLSWAAAFVFSAFLSTQAAAQSKYGLSCYGTSCSTVDQKSHEPDGPGRRCPTGTADLAAGRRPYLG